MPSGYKNLTAEIIPVEKDASPKRKRKNKTDAKAPNHKRVVNREIPERCSHCGSRLNLDKRGYFACHSCGFTTR